jgi:hypothetical protein
MIKMMNPAQNLKEKSVLMAMMKNYQTLGEMSKKYGMMAYQRTAGPPSPSWEHHRAVGE